MKEGKLKKKDLEEKPISEDEIPFEIPASWAWCRFSTYLDVRDGTHDSPKYYSEGVPFVTSKNLSDGNIDFSTCKLISNEDHKKFSARSYVEEGDILFATIGSIGNPVIVKKDRDFSIKNVALFKRYAPQLVNEIYLYYYLSFIQYEFKKIASGGVQSFLGLSFFRDWLYPLPPLAEQKRIVAKIEELLPKVEEYGKAQEALDKLNQELPERLKKSILQDAIEGRLVPQDPNDEPASVLLDKIHKEKARLVKEGKLKKKDLEEIPISEDEIPFEIPKSWEWCKLGTIAFLFGGFAFKSHEYTSTGSRVIRISDITEEGFVDKNVVRYQYNAKLNTYVIQGGDILMAMTGGTVGKSLYAKVLPEEKMLLNQRVANIRTILVFADYIDFVIKSQHIQCIITEAKNSTNDNISMADIYNFPIPLPPLAEQKRIVAKIEELFALIDGIKVS